ncbi:MAG: hypothetical protein OWU84_05395 [Firmicutes bacterium]|nr:hypothetical protein [Bacillota bacterium]
MAEEERGERAGTGNPLKKPVRPHPKPEMGSVNSLNEAVRQELWFIDTMVASPFRLVRRQVQGRRGAWAESLDEAVWALEGMTRLPIKVLQAMFGETFQPPAKPSRDGAEKERAEGEESQETASAE